MELLDKLLAEAVELNLTVSEFRVGKAYFNELKEAVESLTSLKVDARKLNYYRNIPVVLHAKNSIICVLAPGKHKI